MIGSEFKVLGRAQLHGGRGLGKTKTWVGYQHPKGIGYLVLSFYS